MNYTIQLPLNYDSTTTYPVLVEPSDASSGKDESIYWKGTKNTQGWTLVKYCMGLYVSKSNII